MPEMCESNKCRIETKFLFALIGWITASGRGRRRTGTVAVITNTDTVL